MVVGVGSGTTREQVAFYGPGIDHAVDLDQEIGVVVDEAQIIVGRSNLDGSTEIT